MGSRLDSSCGHVWFRAGAIPRLCSAAALGLSLRWYQLPKIERELLGHRGAGGLLRISGGYREATPKVHAARNEDAKGHGIKSG